MNSVRSNLPMPTICLSRVVSVVLVTAALASGCKKEGGPLPPIGPGDRVAEDAPKPKPEAAPPPVAERLTRAHFALDSASLDAGAQAVLQGDAALLRQHSDVRVELQGHCDERGTTEYNLALGDRRAKAAKKYLTSLGVPASRLTTVSYGEERPLDRGEAEDAWALNRRVELQVVEGGEGSLEGSMR